MKFINYLSSISGVSIYPIISLSIFVVFFAFLIIYVLKTDKKHIVELKNIPLENKDSL